MRRKLILALLFLALMPVFSKTEYWTGFDFIYDMNILAEDNKKYFSAYGNGDVSEVNSIGIAWENYIIPRRGEKHLVGPVLNLQFLFPVGYVDSDETDTYISYHAEFRTDLYLGAQYIFLVRPNWGFLAGLGLEHSWYKIDQENARNERDSADTKWVTEWSVGASVGVEHLFRRSYFKLSASFLYTLFHEKGEGFKIFLLAGGGYSF